MLVINDHLKALLTVENISTYRSFPESYCAPGSSIKTSNIEGYRKFNSRRQAEIACNNNSTCKGFTYNKNKKNIY